MNRLRLTIFAVPAGLSLVVCGLLLITTSTLLTHLHLASSTQSLQMRDFLHGFIIGMGIALEIAGLIVMLPAALAAREQRRANSGK